MFERDDHVAGGLLDPPVDVLLRAPDPAVDRRRHFFAQRQQLRHACVIARHRDLDVVDDAGLVERPAESARSACHVPRGARLAGAADFLERLFSRHAGGKLERHEQRDRRAVRPRHASPSIDAVLARQLEAAGIQMLDGRDVQAAGIAGAPCFLRRVAQRPDERQAGIAIRERHEGEAPGRPRRQGRASVTFTTTPSVPSAPMKRSMRSMPGAAK